MRKSTKIVKRILALFLVVLMSINTLGAVVGDNDGSAFITKAEFDSLKNNFQSQIDQYNTSIDSKIDGAIASYLAGINLAKTIELPNNLSTLQKNYRVRWVGGSGSLQNERINYALEYEIQLGSRGTGYGSANSRDVKATGSSDLVYKTFPIISKFQLDGETKYQIDYWEDRCPYIYYCGFFIFNGDTWAQFPTSWSWIKGVFGTANFNPNVNRIFRRQDQWWDPGNGGVGGYQWAMSIWACYQTKFTNTDKKNIYIAPNAMATYCWNESDEELSSGTLHSDSSRMPNCINAGGWGGATDISGSVVLTGYITPDRATFPWCHTQYNYNELYDSRISLVTGVTKPISDGLLITNYKGSGEIQMHAYGGSAASMTIYLKDKRNENILKTDTFNVTTTNTTYKIQFNEVDENEEWNLWVKYEPSVFADLFINDLFFTEA